MPAPTPAPIQNFFQQTITRNQTIVNGVVEEYSEEIVSSFNPNLFHEEATYCPCEDRGDKDGDEDVDGELSISLEKIYEIMASLGVSSNECTVELQENGSLDLKFASTGSGSLEDHAKRREIHFKVMQQIMEHMYLQKISQQAHQLSQQFQTENQNAAALHNLIGEFTIFQHNQPLTTYEYSYEDEDDEEEGEFKPDFFIDDKLINKIIGKPEKIKKGDPLLTNQEECYICFEKYKEREMKRKLPKCGHYFHKKCIDKWLKSKSSCPNCRCDLMEDAQIDDEDLTRYLKTYYCKCPHS